MDDASTFAVPDWLMEAAAKWSRRLRLGEFQIRVEMANVPHAEVHSADASMEPNPLYNRATLYFRVGTAAGEASENMLLHELIHVAHSRVDHFVEEVVLPQLPEAARDLARNGYAAVNEPFVQQMADSLMAMQRECSGGGSDGQAV